MAGFSFLHSSSPAYLITVWQDLEFDGINLKSMTLYLAQFTYLKFNYVILWPQIQINIKVYVQQAIILGKLI
jgi:hypothetical protein